LRDVSHDPNFVSSSRSVTQKQLNTSSGTPFLRLALAR